jgi:Flp pilus assembly protein CpaB
MKRNLMPLLGVAFVAAVVATGIFYGLLIPRLRGGVVAADNTRGVVVANRTLDRGTAVRAEDVRMMEWSSPQLPAQAVTAMEQAIGSTVMEPQPADQPLNRSKLARLGTGGPSLAIPVGRRAVSVHPVESSGVVAMLRSGSRIDIQVIDTRGTGSLRRLMDDVEVLSVAAVDSGRPVVTLLVNPQEADQLSLADASMQLRMVVRNPGDRGHAEPAR